MSTARIEYSVPTASRGRRGWVKVVTDVDTTKSNGYAFEGEFLREGEIDLPVGSIIVEKDVGGSANRPTWWWSVGTVTAEGEIAWDKEDESKYRRMMWEPTQFLSFRDRVAELVAREAPAGRAALQSERGQLVARIAEIDAALAAAEAQ